MARNTVRNTALALFALFGAWAVWPAPAAAQPCAQPSDHCQSGDHWNALASDGLQFVAADNFSPQEDGSLTQVCMWGAYLEGSNECDPGALDDFEVTYLDCGDSLPGTVIAGPFRQSDGTLTVTGPTPTGRLLLDGITEYTYQAAHTPVPVSAGECYWLEIRNLRSDACVWYWAGAEPLDGYAIHGPARDEGYQLQDLVATDLAFCLDVPIGAVSSAATPPVNDSYETAVPITDGAHFFTTLTASTPPWAYPSWGASCSAGFSRDIWFEYVPYCDGMLKVDVCDSNYDSKLSVYLFQYSPHLRLCNDDGCGSTPAQPGTGIGGVATDTVYPCAYRVNAVWPDCSYYPFQWDSYCQALAAAICREPESLQSDVVAFVQAGLPYLISVGGYGSDDGRNLQENPRCAAHACEVDPTCCDTEWDSGCLQLADQYCFGAAGSGVLNVDLVARPPVWTNLRHFHDFLGCFSGPCDDPPCEPPVYVDPCCLNQDFDNDGDVDTDDYAHHLAPSLTGP